MAAALFFLVGKGRGKTVAVAAAVEDGGKAVNRGGGRREEACMRGTAAVAASVG